MIETEETRKKYTLNPQTQGILEGVNQATKSILDEAEQVKAVNEVLKEKIATMRGDGAKIDTPEEHGLFRSAVSADFKGIEGLTHDQLNSLKAAQEFLRKNVTSFDSLKGISDNKADKAARNNPPDIERMRTDTDKTKKVTMNPDEIKAMETGRSTWRNQAQKDGRTYDVGQSLSLGRGQNAVKSQGVSSDADWKTQTSAAMKHFWRNSHFSVGELEATRQLAMGLYDGDPTDKNKFHSEFNKLFIDSIKGTPHSIYTIASHWAQTDGSSSFLGGKSQGFRELWDSLGKDLAKASGLKPGEAIAFNGARENPCFGNTALMMGENGEVDILRSEGGSGQSGRIGYHFGDNENSQTSEMKTINPEDESGFGKEKQSYSGLRNEAQDIVNNKDSSEAKSFIPKIDTKEKEDAVGDLYIKVKDISSMEKAFIQKK